MDIKTYIGTQLNEEQTKAALHTDTSSLILAGAGSGKTRVLTYKIAYLIRGKAIPLNRILAVTFTNKASNEMKERILKISEDINNIPEDKDKSNNDIKQKMSEDKEDSIEDFLNNINQGKSSGIIGKNHLKSGNIKRIGTFHSIFLRILKDDIENLGGKYNKNFGIFDTNETQSVIKDVLKRLNLQDTFKVQEVKSFISTQKNNGNDPKLYISEEARTDYDKHIGDVYGEYQKALEKANSLDFDDLLLLPYLLFKKHKEVLLKRQNTFDYILVDEAQDTNWIQFELMRMLSAQKANITMIGDDFQSIYGRRGALMENFLNVKSYRPDIQMFKLQINYRSKPHIVQAGNEIIKNNLHQYEKNIVAHRQGDDKITIFSHGSEIDEAANIVDLIKKMKEGDKVKSRGAIAILYRTNAQSSPFEQLFLQEGIPYKVRGAYKFFERKEIKDVIAYIKCFINPQDSVSLKRVINIPNRKVGKTSIDVLDEHSLLQNITLTETLQETQKNTTTIKIAPLAKQGIKNFLDVIDFLKDNSKDKRPSEILEMLVKKIQYKDFLIKEEGGEAQAEEKYENIGQLINMAEKYIETGETALRQFMEEVSLLADISENEKGEIDAVKLMTVHSSKGLEFPIVFVAGLEDNIFPLSNAMMEPKLLEEERRLMYVAITRAKDVLFLSYANSRMTWGQTKMNPPSRFLQEIPIELLKRYDLGGEQKKEEIFNIEEGHIVKHKLFGTGYVLETWNNLAIVKFHNPKFGVRKIEMRFLEIVK